VTHLLLSLFPKPLNTLQRNGDQTFHEPPQL
jgi:hypothetical protein